ncbi:MAG TPA: riboflavin synthase [Steroidobacter sp.]|nr:riboflavin synthase [Steroidobacteraceae bacterium]HLS80849.1 riboflavin synthase [Steroidobacter sp.]
MFTGIVQSIGSVRSVTPRGGDIELVIAAPGLGVESIAPGDSISVSGCCLTATRIEEDAFAADASVETLDVTTMRGWAPGSKVNLEKALCAGQPLGGHYVTGHVDGVARLLEARADARSTRLRFEAPAQLAKYIATKGSVCLDGVSLTVNDVEGAVFSVNLIPHTLAVTTFGERRPGDRVNLEVDIIARYVERLRSAGEG